MATRKSERADLDNNFLTDDEVSFRCPNWVKPSLSEA